LESHSIFPCWFAADDAAAHRPEEAPTEEVAVPKPYSILAAALVASGHSLSTVAVAARVDCEARWPTDERGGWFADSARLSACNFESAFATDLLAERASANLAALSE
jgi:hypothetical protein